MGLGYSRATDDFPYTSNSNPIKKGDIFDLYEGTSSGGDKVSLFVFNKNKGQVKYKLAQNAFNKMKTLLHYGVVKFIAAKDAGAQTPLSLMATEPVLPLSSVLDEICFEEVLIGLHQLISTLSFLYKSRSLAHCNISIHSIYVHTTEHCDWKLGDFCFSSNLEEEDNRKFLIETAQFQSDRAIPPEYSTPASSEKTTPSPPSPPPATTIHARDAWAIGNLIEELSDTFSQLTQPNFQRMIQKLKAEEPSKRISFDELLEDEIFSSNKVVHVRGFLKEITIQTTEKKEEFFGTLFSTIKPLSTNALMKIVVPRLLRYQILIQPEITPFLKHFFVPAPMGLLPKNEFDKCITPFFIWAIGENNKHLRASLIQSLKFFLAHVTSDQRKELFQKVLRVLNESDEVQVNLAISALTVFASVSQADAMEVINATLRLILQLAGYSSSSSVRKSALNFLVFMLNYNYQWPLDEIVGIFQSGLSDPEIALPNILLGTVLSKKVDSKRAIYILQRMVSLLSCSDRSIREEARNKIIEVTNHIFDSYQESPPQSPRASLSHSDNSQPQEQLTKSKALQKWDDPEEDEEEDEASTMKSKKPVTEGKSKINQTQNDDWDDWDDTVIKPAAKPAAVTEPKNTPHREVTEEKKSEGLNLDANGDITQPSNDALPAPPPSKVANDFFGGFEPEEEELVNHQNTAAVATSPRKKAMVKPPKNLKLGALPSDKKEEVLLVKSARLAVTEDEGEGSTWGGDDDFTGLDENEAPKGETTKGETKGETTKGETAKGETAKGETAKGETAKGSTKEVKLDSWNDDDFLTDESFDKPTTKEVEPEVNKEDQKNPSSSYSISSHTTTDPIREKREAAKEPEKDDKKLAWNPDNTLNAWEDDLWGENEEAVSSFGGATGSDEVKKRDAGIRSATPTASPDTASLSADSPVKSIPSPTPAVPKNTTSISPSTTTPPVATSAAPSSTVVTSAAPTAAVANSAPTATDRKRPAGGGAHNNNRSTGSNSTTSRPTKKEKPLLIQKTNFNFDD